jgi:outer membrane protein assembly factor BamB
MRTWAVIAYAGFLLWISTPGEAGDWPQWGGRDTRNMVSDEIGLADSFSPGAISRLGPTTDVDHEPVGAVRLVRVDDGSARNVKWRANLGSQCYGNPVVAGGKVFVGTNNFHRHDPAVRGPRGILLCLDEKTGAFLWQFVADKYTKLKMFDTLDLGICSSPTIEGARIYLVTNRAEVLCLDMAGPARDQPPAVAWRFDMIGELNVRPHDIANCSVLVHGDYAYACTSNGVDDSHHRVERPDAPSIIVLDKRTGKLVAEDDANIGPHILHGQWSSPSFGEVGGRGLIFFGGGDGCCYAFDATPQPGIEGKPGVLKKVWWFDCNGPDHRTKEGKPIRYPTAEGPSEIIATPVFRKGRVFVAVGQDPMHGDGPGRLCGIDAAGSGDISENGNVWVNGDMHRSTSTVSVTDGLLFVADFTGAVRCLDPASGKQLWVHAMRGHIWGSTLLADGKVYIGDERGDLTVLAAGREKKVISTTNLGSAIYSTPVAANGVLFVASQTHLYAVGK